MTVVFLVWQGPWGRRFAVAILFGTPAALWFFFAPLSRKAGALQRRARADPAKSRAGAETLPFDWIRCRMEAILHFIRNDFEGYFDYTTEMAVPNLESRAMPPAYESSIASYAFPRDPCWDFLICLSASF